MRGTAKLNVREVKAVAKSSDTKRKPAPHPGGGPQPMLSF